MEKQNFKMINTPSLVTFRNDFINLNDYHSKKELKGILKVSLFESFLFNHIGEYAKINNIAIDINMAIDLINKLLEKKYDITLDECEKLRNIVIDVIDKHTQDKSNASQEFYEIEKAKKTRGELQEDFLTIKENEIKSIQTFEVEANPRGRKPKDLDTSFADLCRK